MNIQKINVHKLFMIFTIALLLVFPAHASSPFMFNYQALIRNPQGEIHSNEYVELEIKILRHNDQSQTVFSELHEVYTNQFGMVNLQIGSLSQSALGQIDWGDGPYFIQLTANGTPLSSSQLISVPYALFAEKSADKFSGDYNDLTNTPLSVHEFELNANGERLRNLGMPEEDQDAATKSMVDALNERINSLTDALIDAGLYTLTDYDGNKYTVVRLGNQLWMAENLKVTHYSDGTPIPFPDAGGWVGDTQGAAAWPQGDEAYKHTYGAMYNYYAVIHPSGLCPEGWHVPTDRDWMDLEVFLGMSEAEANSFYLRGTIEGGKLKSTRTLPDDHPRWFLPNTGATDEVGMSVLPAGSRSKYDGSYPDELGERAFFWTATVYDATDAMSRDFYSTNSQIARFPNFKDNGFSVRCVKANR